MPVVRLDLAYDGTDFHGYARQPAVRTVQGELETAISRVFGAAETVVAGRTDAGVHARHQVVSFEVDAPFDVIDTRRRLNRGLPADVAVTSVAPAPDGFSARFSASARRYRYQVLNREVPDPLRRRWELHEPHPLDAFAMNQAMRHLIGEHDFASLCRKAPGRTTVRTITDCRWVEPEDDRLVLEIAGPAFCHQMVRSVVALALAVGRERLSADDVPDILAARDRNAARGAAPPHGLTLWEISY